MADFAPNVFDINHCQCKVDGQSLVDIGPDGFGITPGGEHSVIEGLKGELGFSIDPSTAATGTVQLKTTSESMKTMISLYNNQTVQIQPCSQVRQHSLS